MTGVETQPRLAETGWIAANQLYLGAEFARLKEALRSGSHQADESVAEARANLDEPAAIDRLGEIFGLSSFERELLLLCAGVEMDSELAALCAGAHGHPERSYVTFGLALATLVQPHWSALTPNSPLRYHRLLEVDPAHGLAHGLMASPVRIDERVLHYLAGVNLLDPRLEPLLAVGPSPVWIAQSHKVQATEAARQAAWSVGGDGSLAPLLHFCGDDPQGQEDAAAYAAEQAGLRLFLLRAEDLPAPGPELELLLRLWRRESLLLPGALLLQCANEINAAARHLAESLTGPLILATRDPIHLRRPLLRFDLDKPAPAEQKQLWERALSAAGLGHGSEATQTASALAQQFRLSARAISETGQSRALPARIGSRPGTRSCSNSGSGADSSFAALWHACRSLARPRLEDLSQRIVCSAGWDDLILPEAQLQTLRQVVAHVRHRMVVYETWGFAAKGRRGLGVSALLTGESGTGKTLAAEVLAHELALDLYRIDLSSVVSKYIGESEKNLRQIFDAAEEGGVALLFDEADALFGKRTEVKDSHDRYANIEVGYLLQRLEAFQGLAILTTNFKSSLDRAFQRRLRFTVNFPFPDAPQRQELWRRAFPPQTPTQGLDPRKLAQLHVTGGNIRNIALHAAFLAAQADRPVVMEHLLEAAKVETMKIERPLSEAEIRGWV